YADLNETNLSQANLRGCDLSYASLQEADLTQADLRGAMLIGTDLRQATVTEANFHDADYDPAETHFPTGFDPAKAAMKSDRAQA
ncbi:MAG: pentapeptide repeat-containing protein, partial [Cyanobacteria bacterium P01_C01_bin.147]